MGNRAVGKMTGDEKKKRDPIFMVCFIVFILAALSVVGVYIDEHYLTEDTTKAAYGDTVTVNYTGTYYAYYGEDNAVVFDTSYSSIGNNEQIIKSNSFNRTSYGTIDVTIGDGEYLKAFEEAIVGHKAGDTVRVEIPNGYPAASEPVESALTGLTMGVTEEMTLSQFESVYDYDLDGNMATIKTVYGWDAMAYLDSASSTVVLIHMPAIGQQYTYALPTETGEEADEAAHSFGTVTYTVTDINEDGIVYDMAFSDYTTVNAETGEIQMIELDFGNETWYVTNVNSDGFTYKTCEERNNITLYFEIEIVSIN